ncbi:hypothetical protein PI124_g14151 [Phytophthora idaei]|nr:hypothetical protein PI125_g21609 [Phytophthora idaei]KAG3132892.1 hypothetical protein PI126_g19431 [Phytophthora idaei]KAG3240971.1 hypothetical protein PI124_g14151 [Phytophthora idaei]
MLTDYGSDISDVPMEDGEIPSSATDSESVVDTPDPITGSWRPCEDDPRALSSKRSRNEEGEKAPTPVTPSSPRSVSTEHAPWMPSASEIASRFGATSPPNPIPLYVYSTIVDDAEAAAQHFDPMTNQRRGYFIGLFHELRWHASKRTSRKSKVPEWVALCQSWDAFVENFNRDVRAYRARIPAAHQRFGSFSRRHMIDRLHNEAMEAGIPFEMPPRGSESLRARPYRVPDCVCVPSQLRDVRVQLERRYERRDTPSVSGDRSARTCVTPAPRSGFRTPSIRTFHGSHWEEILSNKYEDEPSLGSSSGAHSPRFARLSSESSHAHREVVAVGGGKVPLVRPTPG